MLVCSKIVFKITRQRGNLKITTKHLILYKEQSKFVNGANTCMGVGFNSAFDLKMINISMLL